jgi:hypothetical protein
MNDRVWKPGMTLEDVKLQAIKDALEEFGGNKTHAAKALGMSLRNLHIIIRDRDELADFRGPINGTNPATRRKLWVWMMPGKPVGDLYGTWAWGSRVAAEATRKTEVGSGQYTELVEFVEVRIA